MNRVDASKFVPLLSRVSRTVHLKDVSPFAEEEEGQLTTILKLSKSELTSVLDACTFIFEQCAYHSTTAQKLKEHLEKAGLHQPQAEAFINTWSKEKAQIIAHLRERTIVPKSLEEIEWSLQMQLAHSSLSKLKQPVAIFELGLKSQDEDKLESCQMSFSHEELLQFYKNLEVIQQQIDALSS